MSDFLDQLKNDHRQFDQGKLEDFFGDEPFHLMAEWIRDAVEKPVSEPNAMTISTFDLTGFPRARVVYLKDLIEEGIVFYTNYNSAKGKAIEANPHVHALFFWPEMERQISVSGVAEKVPFEMSDSYFQSRPTGSKIGAWASRQSDVLETRAELEQRVIDFAEKFKENVPTPDFWGGYLIRPVSIEFWQGRPSRLHDRIVFDKQTDGSWKVFRKNP